MLRVAMMSSWGEKCGIAEYTLELVKQLSLHVDISLVRNYPTNQCIDMNGSALFHCPFMTHKTTADVNKILDVVCECDLLHVQFETSLYHPSWFPDLIYKVKQLGVRVIFTMHSSGMWPIFDVRNVDIFVSHEDFSSCYGKSIVIPMGVKFEDESVWSLSNRFLVTSFGLGRNMDDFVKQSIVDTGFNFSTVYGRDEWLSRDKLLSMLGKSDVLTLFYPPTGANVSSSAAILALGVNKPLIVSDTNWFNHVRDVPGLFVCGSEQGFRNTLNFIKHNQEIVQSMISSRKQYLTSRGRDFTNFVNEHAELYKKLIAA